MREPPDHENAGQNGLLTFHQLCRRLGKPPTYVRSLQVNLELPQPQKGTGYSPAYASFMEHLVSLRAFSVPFEDIGDALQKERKILELLHVDSISTSPTWYLDCCGKDEARTDRHLLLTGYDLGFPLTAEVIQSNLDFGPRDAELFARHEMGEDIRRVLCLYVKLLDRIRDRVSQEKPVLERALFWSEEVFWTPAQR